jgi:flagellar biosynthesis protein FlhF
MRIKTFYAASMAEALRSVKEEFGSEGLILSTKETPAAASSWFRGKPAVEVVAAIDNGGDSDGDLFTPSAAHAPSARAETKAHLQRTRIDKDYNEMRRTLYSLTRPAVPAGALFSDAAAYEVYQDLVSNEVDEWLAYKLVDEAQTSLAPGDRSRKNALAGAVTAVARDLIKIGTAGDGLPAKQVIALVGPTGVGKTTAAAKLAAYLALEKKKKVVLLTTDTFRIGAVEQLRTYAGLMGVPFRVVAQAADLPLAIHEYSQRDYILIDTAGRCQRDLDGVQDLMGFLQETTNVERHLVLSATTKPLDMREIIDRFGTCNPDCLLFTKLDETSTFGPIFNEMVRTQKPLSYIADGQRVPEDLHAVRGDQIVNIVLNAHGSEPS